MSDTRKRWRYYELGPGEVSRAVKIRCSALAADWFAQLSAAERGELVEGWYREASLEALRDSQQPQPE